MHLLCLLHTLFQLYICAAHAWAARLAALSASREFVQRLRDLAQPGGAAGASAGAPAGAVQGPAVDWLARIVPGACEASWHAALGAPCMKGRCIVLGIARGQGPVFMK